MRQMSRVSLEHNSRQKSINTLGVLTGETKIVDLTPKTVKLAFSPPPIQPPQNKSRKIQSFDVFQGRSIKRTCRDQILALTSFTLQIPNPRHP